MFEHDLPTLASGLPAEPRGRQTPMGCDRSTGPDKRSGQPFERSRRGSTGAKGWTMRRNILLAALCAGLILPACGSNGDGAKKSADPVAVRETFASLKGTTTNLIVAVGPGAKVRAYACDGDSTALWWTGDSSNGSFKSASTDGGATLDVKIGDNVDGTVTFKDSTAISFSAKATKGAQGLYSVELSADGAMTGTSLGGNTFSGQFDFKRNTLAGEVGTPSDETVKISASQTKTGGTTSPGSYLAVLDAEGRAKGFQLKVPGKPAEGFVSGWVMP